VIWNRTSSCVLGFQCVLCGRAPAQQVQSQCHEFKLHLPPKKIKTTKKKKPKTKSICYSQWSLKEWRKEGQLRGTEILHSIIFPIVTSS
jgi:hypothetical protein